jgi:hypothetical protein
MRRGQGAVRGEDKAYRESENSRQESKIMTQAVASGLIGVWRLLSVRVEFLDTGERADIYGPHPSGFLILSDGGRMMAIITAGDRAPPETEADRAALFDAMMAYTGNYRLEDDKFITSVDVAWHPSWDGTEQPRFFELEGNSLSIITPQQTHPRYPGRPVRGILIWHRSSEG